jgi:acetylornithine deacetylase/succinyl-diaminopimelate desuccinylase-like protein
VTSSAGSAVDSIAATVGAEPTEFDEAPSKPIGTQVAAEARARPAPRRAEIAERLEELCSPFGPIVRHRIGPGGTGHPSLSVDGAAPESDGPPPCAAVIGHYGAVWPKGSIERLPARVDADGIGTGPGCFDMKGGLAPLYYAVAERATWTGDEGDDGEHMVIESTPRRAALLAGLPAEV